jgi:hypothetical protein
MEPGTGGWLLPLGLVVAWTVVFAWRNDTVTGVTGLLLSVFAASWLMRTIQAIDFQASWRVSPVPRVYYGVLIALCVLLALASAYDIFRGVLGFGQARRAREIQTELPPADAPFDTATCPYCGGAVSPQALACKHCEGDLYPGHSGEREGRARPRV